jgi:predicted nucleic acid-binding protein
MDRLLVDTNIVIDLLSKREEFYREAQELFTLADQQKVKLYISSLTIANTHYLLARNHKLTEARKIIIKFKVLVETLAFDDKILELALVSDFKDFEDAIQYQTAAVNDLDLIITRNKKDFKNSALPVLTAKEYLKSRHL